MLYCTCSPPSYSLSFLQSAAGQAALIYLPDPLVNHRLCGNLLDSTPRCFAGLWCKLGLCSGVAPGCPLLSLENRETFHRNKLSSDRNLLEANLLGDGHRALSAADHFCFVYNCCFYRTHKNSPPIENMLDACTVFQFPIAFCT